MAENRLPPVSYIIIDRNPSEELAQRCIPDLDPNDQVVIVGPPGTPERDNIYAANKQERAAQFQYGLLKVKHEVVLFVHGDSVLPVRHKQSLLEVIDEVGSASYSLQIDSENLWCKLWSYLSTWNTRFTTYGDQVICVRRSALDAIGGFPDVPFMEDFILQWRLRQKVGMAKITLKVRTSAIRFEQHGCFWQQMRNLVIVVSYLLGVPLTRLKTWYER